MAKEWTKSDLDLIATMGAIHYTPEQIADNLDGVTTAEIQEALKDPNHPVAASYRKGLNRAQLRIDAKLLEMSQQGDLEALKELQKRQRENDAKRPPFQPQ